MIRPRIGTRLVVTGRSCRPWRARVVYDQRLSLLGYGDYVAVVPIESGVGWSSQTLLVPLRIVEVAG